MAPAVSVEGDLKRWQNPVAPRVAFATHCWERDFEIVLDPKRFGMVRGSLDAEFNQYLVVLNNFSSPRTHDRAATMARALVDMGLATTVLDVQDYLTDAVIHSFGLDPGRFWRHNPYFASAQLAALHRTREGNDFLVHFSGDIWLKRPGHFLARALKQFRREDLAGLNLCRDIYQEKYPMWCQEDTDDLWLSRRFSGTAGNGPPLPEEGRGFALSDLAYILRTDLDYRFADFDHKIYNGLAGHWPPYARPCFELYFAAFLHRSGLLYGTLKPVDEIPVTKHKNFSPSRAKKLIYRMLGRYYPGGRYATMPREPG